MAMPDLHRRADWPLRLGDQPIHSRRVKSGPLQRRLWADDHCLIRRMQPEYVQWLRRRRRETEAFALTDREAMDPVMSAEDATLLIDK